MSSLNFDPPETRGVDYSERTDPDSGGGMNFVFHDRGGGQRKDGKNEQEDGKKHKPADFGNAVEVELSGQPEAENSVQYAPPTSSEPADDSDDDQDDSPVKVTLSVAATSALAPPHTTGHRINITV